MLVSRVSAFSRSLDITVFSVFPRGRPLRIVGRARRPPVRDVSPATLCTSALQLDFTCSPLGRRCCSSSGLKFSKCLFRYCNNKK